MASISAIIITFNEEKNIERCLNSIKNIADEIIVVDSFSVDRTREICKSFNVKFIEKKWEGYSATKNFANSLATKDYILSIDADEEISEDLFQSIRCIKTKPEADAYSMNRLTNYCGKWIHHSGWYPDTKIRLWKKNLVEWQGIVHEKAVILNSEKVSHLNGNLLHYSYYSIEEHKIQAQKFSSLSAMDYYENNKNASIANLIFSPIIKFLKDYIFNLGFLDGYYGFIICKISAKATLNKYLTLRNLHKKRNDR